ncbi:hypothetical protein F5141DRAFT_105249 [Pisolithus sp. B1]|nr:hypothetical protein F5141DRAFT_105249 [Pisolithus sp. B1]
MASTDGVACRRAELRCCRIGHSGRDVALSKLAEALYDRFQKERKTDDLNEAIASHRAALELRPPGNKKRSSSLSKLAICQSDRYGRQGAVDDLEEAVTLGRAALDLRPPGHPNRYVSLYNLACDLRTRFGKQADMHDLEEAIELHRTALGLHLSGHPDRSSSFLELALCLSTRYHNQGVVADLEEAVTLGHAALDLRPPGHPDRGISLNSLACDLRRKFEKQADMRDLEEAIELHRATLALLPIGHRLRLSSLQDLALCLSIRYDSQGVVADLEEAVTLGRAALELHPLGHPDRSISLTNLACDLRRRFEKQANIPDLVEAIQLHHVALELRPSGHPLRLSSLQYLVLCLRDRYINLGVAADLEEAITLGRAALGLHSSGHPDRGTSLNSLACDLRRRFQQQADMRDLEEAIELQRAALALHPPGHPLRLPSLQNLARSLSDRYTNQRVVANFCGTALPGRAARAVRSTGQLDRYTADLDEAIALERDALRLLTPGDRSYDRSRRRLTARLQVKMRSQVVTPPSNASPSTNSDIKRVIRNVAFETLQTMPTRLLHTQTGILCNRDAQLSHFMNSEHYDQLVSSCATCDPSQQMRLIRTGVSIYFRFAMLSHRWGDREPSLRDIEGHPIYVLSTKGGLGKLHSFCAITFERGYLWAWSDTCCIDKDSSAEFQEAIGSMFAWYRQSSLTIVYLSDVRDNGSLVNSQWFSRGWTLQELLAPHSLLFYTQTWSLYKDLTSSNHKTDVAVVGELERATGIEPWFLTNFSPGMDDARSRLQWASLRRTTRPEDIAYSLFGIFCIHLPVLYGESAENALGRLLAKIISQSGDISVLDWVGEASQFHSCFPAEISSYRALPLPSPQSNLEEHVSIIGEQPAASSALQTLYRLFDKSPLPRFVNRRLTLRCITYTVTGVRLKGATPYASSYTYEIRASGLKPLEITLPCKLENETMLQGALLVRPWHSKLLDPYIRVYARMEDRLLHALGRPFNTLLLIALPHNEYKRVASSTIIISHPADYASILQSEVRTLDIV